jgi:hypothetical protein
MAEKIRGKIHCFGKWARRENGKLVRVEGDGWKEALEEYKAVADDLHAGRTPRARGDGLTVAHLCNRFLTAKRRREAGDFPLVGTCDQLLFGLADAVCVPVIRRLDEQALTPLHESAPCRRLGRRRAFPRPSSSGQSRFY